MTKEWVMTHYEAAILKWATDHFGPDCSPSLSHEDDDGLVLSLTKIAHGTHRCYHLPIEPLENGWFHIQGVTVDTNRVRWWQTQKSAPARLRKSIGCAATIWASGSRQSSSG
jgi:hypothetical protein